MHSFYHAHLFSYFYTSFFLLDVFIYTNYIRNLPSSDSKLDSPIIKEPPPLPKPRRTPKQLRRENPEPKPGRIPEPVQREISEPKIGRIPEVGRMKLVEPKPRRILSHKRALQAVIALAITVGVLVL